MTPAILCEHVQQSIDRAKNHQSWIDESCLSIRGFSTGVQRRLISNITHMPKADPVYFEAGLYGGAMICSAMNNNPDLIAYGCEDFSQDFGDPEIREHLDQNIKRYCHGAKRAVILNYDFFKLDLSEVKHPVDVYVYDAVHSFTAQRDNLPFFLPALADVFVYLVDDADWVPVRTGLEEGIASLGDKIKVEQTWNLSDGKPDGENFHNGILIAVISKQ